MFIISLQRISKAEDTRFSNSTLLKFEAEAKSLRPRPKGPKAKAEADTRGYEAEAESNILASRSV